MGIYFRGPTPLHHWGLPEQFAHLRGLLEARMGRKRNREYIQVLRLMELFVSLVAADSEDAIKLGPAQGIYLRLRALAGMVYSQSSPIGISASDGI